MNGEFACQRNQWELYIHDKYIQCHLDIFAFETNLTNSLLVSQEINWYVFTEKKVNCRDCEHQRSCPFREVFTSNLVLIQMLIGSQTGSPNVNRALHSNNNPYLHNCVNNYYIISCNGLYFIVIACRPILFYSSHLICQCSAYNYHLTININQTFVTLASIIASTATTEIR